MSLNGMASMCRLCVCCVEFVFYRVNDLVSLMACVLDHTNICVNLLIICMHGLCLLCRPYGCDMRVFCGRRATVLYSCLEAYLHILHDCTELGTIFKNLELSHSIVYSRKVYFLWETSLTYCHIQSLLSVPILYVNAHQQTVYHQPTSWPGQAGMGECNIKVRKDWSYSAWCRHVWYGLFGCRISV